MEILFIHVYVSMTIRLLCREPAERRSTSQFFQPRHPIAARLGKFFFLLVKKKVKNKQNGIKRKIERQGKER